MNELKLPSEDVIDTINKFEDGLDIKKDFLQPVLNTQKDIDTYIVENSPRKARDETVAERADRHMFIWHGGVMPKHYDDPFIKKVDVMAGLPEVNKIVDQRLKDEDKKLFPTGPKLAEVPILKRNIKYPKQVRTNPTIERYKNFKEEKKFKEEEKKFNLEFEKEYGEEATENHVKAKIKNNETLTMNDHFINEHMKDRAREKLAARNAAAKTLQPKYATEAIPTQLNKSTTQPEPKISVRETIRILADRRLAQEQKRWDRENGRGGIAEMLRPK